MAPFATLFFALNFPLFVSAYSWTFQNTPQACKNLSIAISGTGGSPPYRVLILPFGASPLSNFVEARKIIAQSFDNDTSVSFQLKYPENSQFVAVVSDSTGFGSGGTSVAAIVEASDDSSCYNSTVSVSPDFAFNIQPPNQIVQCVATRLWWDPAVVEGQPSFVGVIPGGQSFGIPNATLTTVAEQGVGFNWTPSVVGGTTLYIVAGDDRGAGAGGSALNTVGFGTNPDNSCLNATSPSSTPGSPAGGTYATSTSSSSSGSNNNRSSTNVGAIAGGVVGGVVGLILIILVLLFFWRRQRVFASQREKPVDLLQDDDEGDATHHNNRNELPQYYEPEPFIIPEPTVAPSSTDGHAEGRSSQEGSQLLGAAGRRASDTLTYMSGANGLGLDGAGSSTSTGTRKTGFRTLRPVNIIQHDDAGPSEGPPPPDEEPETIELPPAYTNIRTTSSPSTSGSGSGSAPAS